MTLRVTALVTPAHAPPIRKSWGLPGSRQLSPGSDLKVALHGWKADGEKLNVRRSAARSELATLLGPWGWSTCRFQKDQPSLLGVKDAP